VIGNIANGFVDSRNLRSSGSAERGLLGLARAIG
jgi:hypothetical protein